MSTPHTVYWDAAANRPIVDGKMTDPLTGAIVPAGPLLTTGPLAIDAIWINIKASESGFRIIRFPTGPNLGTVFLPDARVVQQGLVELVSVNGSSYAVTVVCSTDVTAAELREVLDQVDGAQV